MKYKQEGHHGGWNFLNVTPISLDFSVIMASNCTLNVFQMHLSVRYSIVIGIKWVTCFFLFQIQWFCVIWRNCVENMATPLQLLETRRHRLGGCKLPNTAVLQEIKAILNLNFSVCLLNEICPLTEHPCPPTQWGLL